MAARTTTTEGRKGSAAESSVRAATRTRGYAARGETSPRSAFDLERRAPGPRDVQIVAKVGGDVRGFKAGDLAAVGCLVDSCKSCTSCREGLEQYCETGSTLTYNSPDKHMPGRVTCGGYSSQIVVDERFVFRVPDGRNLAAVAPLLCWSDVRYRFVIDMASLKG